jgi:hypothetical protein
VHLVADLVLLHALERCITAAGGDNHFFLINGSATIDHETARKRRFVAVEK